MNLIDYLTIDDLKGEVKEMADVIGLEAFKALVSYYDGTFTYIPKVDTVTLPLRNRAIIDQFDGSNIHKLCRDYNLAEPSIRAIVSDKLNRLKNNPPAGQESLF
jgi:Mor family transcriptional regulator